MKKYIIIGLLIGFLSFPTIILGSTFISSLIEGKTMEEAMQILSEQTEILIGRIIVLEDRADKEAACRKANELKIAPKESKIAYYTEQNNQPIYASWAPDTTEELLEYLNGYIQNHEKTGSYFWLHNPDYMPELVRKYIPILEERQKEYLKQQQICNE